MSASKQSVVIDGRNLPSQFIAAALLSAELRERGFHPIVVRTGSEHLDWQQAIAEALGVDDCLVLVRLRDLSLTAIARAFGGALQALALAYIPARSGMLVRLIQNFHYRGIRLGDLVFDSFVKRGNVLRPAARPWAIASEALRATLRVEQTLLVSPAESLFAFSTYVYATEAGILARRAMHEHGVPAIMYSSAAMMVTGGEKIVSSRHSRRTRFVLQNERSRAVLQRADSALEARLSGRTANKDARVAFNAPSVARSSKEARHSQARLAEAEQLSRPRCTVLLAAHSLTDAVHASGPLVFRDYAEWIRRTLRWAKKNRIDARWVVKEHPYAPVYKEVGLVEALVRRARMPNAEFVPHSSNTRDVLFAADVVVTARGTIGIEAVALGKTLIVAGATPYSDLQIVQEPETEVEYFDMLRSAIEVRPIPPTDAQQSRARLALLFEEQSTSLSARLGLDQFLDGMQKNKRKMRDQISQVLKDPGRLRDVVMRSQYREELIIVLDEFEAALAHPN